MPEVLYGPFEGVRRRTKIRRLRAVLYSVLCSVATIAILAIVYQIRSHARHETEPARASTATGDDRYFDVPMLMKSGYRICRNGAGTIVAAATLPIVSPDSDMKRVDACSDRDLNLYAQEQSPSHLFVKTDVYRYLEVRVQ